MVNSPTQIGIRLLFRGDHQAAVICGERDGQAHILLLRPRHVAYHRQQADRVGVTGQAEPVDLEPAGERQTSSRRETSALWRTSVSSFRTTYRCVEVSRHAAAGTTHLLRSHPSIWSRRSLLWRWPERAIKGSCKGNKSFLNVSLSFNLACVCHFRCEYFRLGKDSGLQQHSVKSPRLFLFCCCLKGLSLYRNSPVSTFAHVKLHEGRRRGDFVRSEGSRRRHGHKADNLVNRDCRAHRGVEAACGF